MENIEYKETRNLFYKLLIAAAVVIPLVIGSSYAYYLAKIQGDAKTIQGTAVTGFYFNLETENDGYISATNMIPIKSTNVETEAPTGIFKVTTGANQYSVQYTISLSGMTITNKLKTQDFKWSLTCTSCSDTTKNTSGNFKNATGTEMVLLSNAIISPNSEDDYELKLWIEETAEDQIDLLNQSFSAKVKAVGEFIAN